MASAAPSFHSTKESVNYARLCRLLVDVGAHVLRETFEKKRLPGSLDTVFSTPPAHAILKSLRKKRVLNPLQWGKLYPAIKSSVSSKNFDITLLMVLLRNICGLIPPATGWDTPPHATDTTLEADIVRIKCYRNTVYGHATEALVDDATFSQYWQDIQDALVRLGGPGYQAAIDDLKNECMDPDFEEHYQELLKQWVKDEVSIKERLEEIEVKFGRMHEDLKELMASPDSKTTVEDVNAYTCALKASVKSQTEFQTKLKTTPDISSVKTDEIFTTLLIQHGRKPVADDTRMGRRECLRQYGQVSETRRVKHCQEIFISDQKQKAKSILVTGKAGIGKTLFSQKLIRDWADDQLFQAQIKSDAPDFQFAYLLTFRQLNLLGDERVSLRDVLNRSSVLDEHSNIDESLFDYIVNHSEEALIVIDGFDESSQQDYIASDLDEQYPNNVHEKMPVAALCAKLIKGKILRGSVVMMTSRPDESDKLERIHFDQYVEITGFSEQQVKEYVEKYFKENETMKNTVLDHITKNEDLVSFAHIPVLCFLMCSYLEYILMKKKPGIDALPVKTSDLYFEVVNRFVLDHTKKEIPSEVTLDKLSELAAQLLQQKKFLFTEEDMNNFSLEEIESMRGSGLLHCGPPFRKSFSEVTKHFCFTHMTLQEYLASCWFVKKREIPSKENVSSVVVQFMAGILSKERGTDKFMEKLLVKFPSRRRGDILLTAKCLFEYQDKEFAKHFIKKRHRKYFSQFSPESQGKTIYFTGRLTDVDCIAVSFLIDIINALNEKGNTEFQTCCEEPIRCVKLVIANSLDLSQTGLRRICEALGKDLCTITKLSLYGLQLNGEFADFINGLVASKLTELALVYTRIIDADVDNLCQALDSSTCKLASLELGSNSITDISLFSLCHVLQSSSCQITSLRLSGNKITDAGVVYLCQALQLSTCHITKLSLEGNYITDAGVFSLSQALQSSTCQVTSLQLISNQITDTSVLSLSQALQSTTCQVTKLWLCFTQITDVGVFSLCQALQSSPCQVTLLCLPGNQITDAGVFSLCQALRSSACNVTLLDLQESTDEISDIGMKCLADLKHDKPDIQLIL